MLDPSPVGFSRPTVHSSRLFDGDFELASLCPRLMGDEAEQTDEEANCEETCARKAGLQPTGSAHPASSSYKPPPPIPFTLSTLDNFWGGLGEKSQG